MKHCVLLCAAVLEVALAASASAQYIYLDVNGDGECTSFDYVDNTVMGIDIWLDTNHNAAGDPIVCPSGEPYTINSYAFILSSTGGVTYGTWADNIGFTAPAGGAQAGNDIWLARVTTSTYLAPGKYKIGTMPVTVTGSPIVSILSQDAPLDGTAITAFGSQCVGVNFDNTIYLGACVDVGISADFCEVCGSRIPDPAENTTWGKIKELYRKR